MRAVLDALREERCALSERTEEETMSYARFGDNSDVYVYADVNGYVACCGCKLGGRWDFHSPQEIVEHLHEHVTAGQMVDPELLEADMYPPEDFVAMCQVFLCREQEGHGGDHTPIDPKIWRRDAERFEQIRARQIKPEPGDSGRAS